MQEDIQQKEIRNYLLGLVSLDEDMEQIEKRMLTEEEYFKKMLSTEDELIQDYVDGELSEKDKTAFERHFLLSEENREKLKFSRAFRKYLNEQEPGLAKSGTAAKERWTFPRIFPLSPAYGVGLLALGFILTALFSVYVLNSYHRYSESQQSLALLNKAYKTGRPLGSRISDLDYAHFDNLRSDEPLPVDEVAFEGAKSQIFINAGKDPNAANLILTGSFHLTQKEFDKAIVQFENAQKLDADNVRILNDLGVAYLEKGLIADEDGAAYELFSTALGYFDRALKLDPQPEARFNRARCLEAMSQMNQAREAWNEYLKYDTTSGWAVEARQHLQELDTQSTNEMNDDELQEGFLGVARSQNDDGTLRLISQNRELIKKKYLPQKIAMSLVEAEGARKAELFAGLKYLGDLEKKSNNDNFASDLAEFYSRASPEQMGILKKAQAAMSEGYGLLLDEDDFTGAQEKFFEAQKLFIQTGDTVEANVISKHFIGYCFYNTNRKNEANDLFRQVDEFTRKKKYKWFSLMNLYWFIYSRESLGYMSTSDAVGEHEKALETAENLSDIYMTQKFLLALVSRNSFLKDRRKTFSYLAKLVKLSAKPGPSARQVVRNLDEGGIDTLAKIGFPEASRAFVRESLYFSEVQQKPLFAIGSLKRAAAVYVETGDYQEAEDMLVEAKQKAEALKDETQQVKEKGNIYLGLGDVENARQNLPKAAGYYDQALGFLEKTDEQIALYEAKKSKLLVSQALGDDAQVEKELVSTLDLTEKYRSSITKEEERDQFFDYQQQVYDAAIEYEFGRDQAERAFNYAEGSNSRSLLDWLNKKAGSSEPAGPLQLNEIRDRMPVNVQVLQYAVLKDKVVIWVVSREKLSVASSGIGAVELKSKVDDYVKLLRSRDGSKLDEVSRLSAELYRLLIEPALPYLVKESELCIVPNKSLFNLPFASLSLPNGQFFLEQFSFFYSPSANVLILATGEARQREGKKIETILSIGNPAFDRTKLRNLPDLKESIAESRDVAQNYPERVVLQGSEATKTAFQKDLKAADVLHFAGHYIVHPSAPLLSELVMAKSSDNDADNFLTNYELRDQELPRAKLVVLSACQTGVEGYYNGEGLIGLSRTFLSLGIPLVVASQWSVDSTATSILMKKFHKYRKQENLSSVHALRKAQLEMLNTGEFRSPFYWAGFAAFGGYAEF